MNTKAIHQSNQMKQLTQLYAMSHQELFEIVKAMAFQTVAICHHLQGAKKELPGSEHLNQAIEYAASFIPVAIEEAKHFYRPTGWSEVKQ